MNVKQHIVAIHQPNFLPWLGYFHKMILADTFILFDDVQINWEGFTRRVPIRKSLRSIELTWINAPIAGKYKGKLIQDIWLTNLRTEWHKTLVKIHHIYAKAPYFGQVFPILERLNCPEQASLTEFNMSLIHLIGSNLDIQPRMILSSEYHISGSGTEKLIGLVRASGGYSYLSGVGGRKYQDEKAFELADIQLQYVDNPSTINVLTEYFPGALAESSIIDWLCLFGWEAIKDLLHNRLKKEYEIEHQ